MPRRPSQGKDWLSWRRVRAIAESLDQSTRLVRIASARLDPGWPGKSEIPATFEEAPLLPHRTRVEPRRVVLQQDRSWGTVSKKCRLMRSVRPSDLMSRAAEDKRRSNKNEHAPRRPQGLLQRAHTRSTKRHLVTCEPVSGHTRTGLRHDATDIENCRPETRAWNSRSEAEKSDICVSETARYRANRRECRVFSHLLHIIHRDRTGWLGD